MARGQSHPRARSAAPAQRERTRRGAAGPLDDGESDRRDGAARRPRRRRLIAAAERGDVLAALDADDDLHAVPVEALGNAAVTRVLEQFGPIVRRAERLRFGTDASAAAERHERFIALCEKRDAAAAAMMAYETWHTLPVTAPRATG